MRPPPGGGPYLDTISGGASRVDSPNTNDLTVVGTLSSSTQMYSGSLATSQQRGLRIRSHLGSAARRAIDASLGDASPRYSRQPRPPHPATVTTRTPARTSPCTRGKIFMMAHSISEPPSSPWLPGWLVGREGLHGNRCSAEPSVRLRTARRENRA